MREDRAEAFKEMQKESIRALVDRLSQKYHEAQRRVIYNTSGNIARDLRELREEVDAERATVGLDPSPVEPVYEDEEVDIDSR